MTSLIVSHCLLPTSVSGPISQRSMLRIVCIRGSKVEKSGRGGTIRKMNLVQRYTPKRGPSEIITFASFRKGPAFSTLTMRWYKKVVCLLKTRKFSEFQSIPGRELQQFWDEQKFYLGAVFRNFSDTVLY